MSQFNLDAPFDVGDKVYVANRILDRKLHKDRVTMSLCCSRGSVINIKRELDTWSGKPFTRVKIELEGGIFIKIPQEFWEEVIFTDEKECEQACYVSRFGEGDRG